MQASLVLENILELMQTGISLLFILATIVFLIGVIRFIASAGNPEARAKTQGILLWGIVGLAAMVAAWGVVQLAVDFFGVPSNAPEFVPPPLPENQAIPETQTPSDTYPRLEPLP